MATNVTRDHHNLRRNLKLNGNYLSNDGGDEGISIQDDGDVIINGDKKLYLNDAGGEYLNSDGTDLTIVSGGKVLIDKDINNTTAATASVLHIDLDRVGDVSSGSDLITGIDIDVNQTGASGGIISSTGLDIDVTGDAGGTSIATGVSIDVSGADTCTGIYINNKNGGIDFKNTSSADSTDYFTINTIEDGETTLTTVEAGGGSTAHLNMVADGNFAVDAVGDISLDAAGGDVTILQADLTIPVDKKVIFGNTGEHIAGDDTHLTVTSSGNLNLSTGRYIYLKDGANSEAYFDFNGNTHNKLHITGSVDAADYFNIVVIDNGETTLTTNDNGGTAAHLNIEANGHIDFNTSACGFTQLTVTFGASGVIGGAGNDTDVDFRLGNKALLELTGNLGGLNNINLIFPAVSGNFVLVLEQDGTGSRTIHADAWEGNMYISDGSTTATTANPLWAGGSAPTLTTTADAFDIISFYWDATNGRVFAVPTLNFS